MTVKTTFGVIDYLVFVGLLVVSSLIGVFFGWRDRNEKDHKEFLTGGRNLQVFPVAMSLAASFMSTNTILGVPAEVYSLGTQYSLHLIGFTVAVVLAAKIFMPIYYDLELTSVNKYLLRRFHSNAVRLAGSVGFIMSILPYMGVVLFGPSLALSSVTPLSIPKSILLVGLVCTFYTSIGGIKAVIWTDVIQCSLMILGLLIVIVHGSIQAGGFAEPFKTAHEGGRIVLFNLSPDIHRSDTLWASLFGLMIGWVGTYCVKQTQVQRYCCLKSKEKARQALYLNIPVVLIIGLLAIWCGIVIYAKYRDCDPVALNFIERTDQLMPFFVMDTMSHIPGLPGLFVACVFSGALSTLSSGFNALATVTWDDFLKRPFSTCSPKTCSLVIKITAALYGLLSIGIAFLVGRLGTVLQGSLALSGSVTGPLLAMFSLGIFFPFVNAKGAFIGLISGFGFCFWITIGTIINPRPKVSLPLSTDGCSADVYNEISYSSKFDQSPKMLPSEYHPEGMNQLYHVSYMYISLVGFVVSSVVGVVVSLLTGGDEPSDPKLLSPFAAKLCPRWVEKSSEDHSEKDGDPSLLQHKIKNGANNMEMKRSMQPVVKEVRDLFTKSIIEANPLVSSQDRVGRSREGIDEGSLILPSTMV